LLAFEFLKQVIYETDSMRG